MVLRCCPLPVGTSTASPCWRSGGAPSGLVAHCPFQTECNRSESVGGLAGFVAEPSGLSPICGNRRRFAAKPGHGTREQPLASVDFLYRAINPSTAREPS